MNLKFHFSILVPLFISSSIFAQNIKADLMQITKKMNSDKIGLSLHYKLFIDNSFDKVYQQRNMTIVKSGAEYLIKQDKDLEYMSTRSAEVMVDNKFHKIIYKSKEKKSEKISGDLLNYIDTNLDSIFLGLYDKVTFSRINERLVKYECLVKNGEHKKIEIFIDQKSMVLNKIKYFFRDPIQLDEGDEKLHPLMLEMSYDNFTTSPQISNGSFSLYQYFTVAGILSTKLNAKYAAYELINLNETYEN